MAMSEMEKDRSERCVGRVKERGKGWEKPKDKQKEKKRMTEGKKKCCGEKGTSRNYVLYDLRLVSLSVSIHERLCAFLSCMWEESKGVEVQVLDVIVACSDFMW